MPQTERLIDTLKRTLKAQHKTYQDVARVLQLSEGSVKRLLSESNLSVRRLDRLKILDFLPGNRIKLRVSANFAWRPDGPIQRFFQERVKEDFFRTRFDAADERLIVVNGMLSRSSSAVFQRKLQRLVRDFGELNDADADLPLEQRFGISVVLATRPWGYGVFAGLRRPEAD